LGARHWEPSIQHPTSINPAAEYREISRGKRQKSHSRAMDFFFALFAPFSGKKMRVLFAFYSFHAEARRRMKKNKKQRSYSEEPRQWSFWLSTLK
jgi:hypothetical protein